MLNNIILIFALVLATLDYLIFHRQDTIQQVTDLYIVYMMVFTVGIIGGMGFIAHIFYANETAELIGWPTGSPFQREVGFHDGAWGLLGFLSIFFREKFWLATGLGWSFFMLGASYGHIKEMIMHGDYAPYNAGIIFSDTLIPIIILILLFLKFVTFAKK